jgi:hypothetical protein
VRQRRVVLEAKDAYTIWVNSKVLKDISPLPESVDGGFIVRDALGKPTGDGTQSFFGLEDIEPRYRRLS